VADSLLWQLSFPVERRAAKANKKKKGKKKEKKKGFFFSGSSPFQLPHSAHVPSYTVYILLFPCSHISPVAVEETLTERL
jgi:hypothetical protein